MTAEVKLAQILILPLLALELAMIQLGVASRLTFEGDLNDIGPRISGLVTPVFLLFLLSTIPAVIGAVILMLSWARSGGGRPTGLSVFVLIVAALFWLPAMISIVNFMS